MMPHAHSHSLKAQRGAVLVTSLILLVALTVLGLAAMQTTSLEERMSGNLGEQNTAFQAGETGLRAGEDFLKNMSAAQVFDGSSAGLIQPVDNPGSAADFLAFWSDASKNRTPATTVTGVADQPRYVIEELPYTPAPGGSAVLKSSLDSGPYRITARGVGRTNSANAYLQSTFRN